ncbi:MAG: hypothetical protein SFU99_05485 [Saprospiraceae bacterium]|nr:hypothetical protein [Saprospiraceae bacterium]
MQKTLFVILFLACVSALSAQITQKSNVYLFDLNQYDDTTFQLSKPRYLTAFNANGYNNHPAFFNEDTLLLSVQMPGDQQPELYLFDLRNNAKTRVTQTTAGEYSPFSMEDGFRFSAVRQEYGRADTTLRLWEFPIDRLNDGRPVFKYFDNIGYYYWINSGLVAVFLVGNPNQLAIADTRTDKLTPVATNVGRCFRTLPNGNLAFVQKSTYESWKLRQKKWYGSAANEQPEDIADTVSGAEDFVVLPDGSFIMGKGTRLFHLNPKSKDRTWREIADLRFYSINNISRLALSNDMKLVLVAD